MNITLIIVFLIIIGKAYFGFKKGMTKEISGLISWILILFIMSIVIMLYTSFFANEAGNTIFSVIILVAIAILSGIIRLVLKPVKLISKLPLFHFADQLLGLVIGAAEGLLIVWLLYVLNEGGVFGGFGDLIRSDTAASEILSYIYEYNYLAKLAAGFR